MEADAARASPRGVRTPIGQVLGQVLPLWPLAAAVGSLVALDRLALATARPPRKGLDRTSEDLGVPAAPVAFPAVDGVTLRGEWIEPATREPGAPLAVLVHGWTGNSGTMLLLAGPLIEAGFPVFVFDVRRHGRSDDGDCVTIRHFRDDVRRALEVARDRRPGAPVVMVGHSLGGSAAILAAAAGAPLDGLAVIAAPADVFEVTAGMFSERGLPGSLITRVLRPFWQRRAGESFGGLNPGASAAGLAVPLFVAQGDRDHRVPASHAERLASAAGTQVRWIPGAGHKDVLTRPELAAELVRFLSGFRAGTNGRSDAGRPSVDVLAAVVRSGDRILVCRRPRAKRHGGLWEFPGGKVKEGESWERAAARELREELGVELVRMGDPVFARQDPGSPFLVHFVDVAIVGEPEPREHEELRWAALSELAALPLAPADAAFAAHLAGDAAP